MGTLQVIFFGGLELWRSGRRQRGFESAKTAALFSYLLLHRGRRFPREHLAALLWPDAAPQAGRANLRQALHNIRETMPRGRGHDWIPSDATSVGFSSTADVWVDCEEFDQLLRSHQGETTGPQALARAVGLYRGDLLDGLVVRDSEPFELWLVTEQERFRRAALDGLRRLVKLYMLRGEYRLGIEYATRLVELDPLSEADHRLLMRLYSFAGERSAAMVHYRNLEALLQKELDIAPQQETTRLFEEIASGAVVGSPPRPRLLRRPVVPFVGRRAVWEQLAECWRKVHGGGSQITLVEGEEGLGKTRLIRSFLDDLSAREQLTVVPGRFPQYWPHRPYEPLGYMVEQLLAHLPGGRESLVRQISEVGRWAISTLRSLDAPEGAMAGGRLCPRDALAEGLAELMRGYVGARDTGSTGRPVVLFFDDLEHAGPSALRLLSDVIGRLAQAPVWVVAACSPLAYAEPTEGVGGFPSSTNPRPVPIEMKRLAAEEILEIVRGLVETRDVDVLSHVLIHSSDGLPLAVVLLVNTLWDEGVLQPVPGRASSWRVANRQVLTDLGALSVPELVLRRLAGLPPSARRLASLAAVAADEFDAHLLAQAEGEVSAVVDAGIEVLMERWFIRQSPTQWATSGLQAGATMWGAGARSLRLDFDHPLIRRAIVLSLPERRRRLLHTLLAAALRQQEGAWEGKLAYHYAGAEAWLEAAQFALTAAERALAVGADEDAARTLRFTQRWARLAAERKDGLRSSGAWKAVEKRLEDVERRLRRDL